MKQPLRILHLEDSPRDAEIVSDVLESAGIQVEIVHALDADQFHDRLEQAAFDVILCDHNIPGYDGVTALADARKKQPGVPVLMVSGTIGEEEAVRCLHAGAVDYVLKDRLGRLGPTVAAAVEHAAAIEGQARLERERREAEEQLRKLSLAVEQSSESIVMTDLDGTIQYVNEAFTRISGYSREEVLGQNPRILNSGTTPAETYGSLWSALTRGETWCGEFHNRRKDGSLYVESAVVGPIRQPGGQVTHYVAVKRDITEKRQLDQELARHRHELERLVAERTAELADARQLAEAANQAKSVFLATMSHEIRTPMNGVLGLLEVLAQSRLTPPQADLVGAIRESGAALLSIIDDILDFSKIEAGRLEIEAASVSIEDVVESVAESLVAVAARKDVDLQVFVANEIPVHVLSDSVRLRQVLYNLVGNAIKFSSGLSGRRGRVSVRATPARLHPPRVAFTVADNGIGMDGEFVERLFEPFSQGEASTTRRYGGTGLGLAICRRLVDLMGGDISVDSAPGVGSTFVVTLPLVVPPDQPARSDPDVRDIPCLVIDSPDFDFTDLTAYLANAGAQVLRVGSPEEAIRLAESLAGPAVVVRHIGRARPKSVKATGDPHLVRHLLITHGRRRRARVESPSVVSLDGVAVRRQTLLHTVAVAAGRRSPEVAPELVPDATMRAVPPPTVDEARRRGELILVAEDDEVNRMVIREQLRVLGRTAEIASNGVEALEMCRAGEYALVLTDLHMPHMDGYALARAIRFEEARRVPAEGRRMPVVALTANALHGEAERALAAGLDDYLTKPLKLDTLRRALDRFLPPVAAPGPAEPPSPSRGGRPVLDVDTLRQLVGNDPLTVKDLLGRYRLEADRQVAALRAALDRNDADTVAGTAHKLKSSSRAVGAMALGELCADLEASANARVEPRVRALDHRLLASFAEVAGAIDAYLAEPSSIDAPDG